MSAPTHKTPVAPTPEGVAGPGTPPPNPVGGVPGIEAPAERTGASAGKYPAPAARPPVAAGAGSSPIAAAMSEGELENCIRRILKDLPQILWYHTHDSRRSPSGFPDLVCVGPRGVLYRELKRQNGKLTKAQEAWLAALTAAGQDAGVWRPDSLLSCRIARQLAALAGMDGAA